MNKATHSTTRAEALRARKWWIVDATDLTVGRAATRIATLLKGKHKPSYTPSLDTGDFVVVVNAEQGPLHRQEGAGEALLLAHHAPRRRQADARGQAPREAPRGHPHQRRAAHAAAQRPRPRR